MATRVEGTTSEDETSKENLLDPGTQFGSINEVAEGEVPHQQSMLSDKAM